MTVTAATDAILPAMHQLTITENAPQTEEDGKGASNGKERQKPQQEKDLSGFDFANRRVIYLRNEWSCAAAICRGTPP